MGLKLVAGNYCRLAYFYRDTSFDRGLVNLNLMFMWTSPVFLIYRTGNFKTDQFDNLQGTHSHHTRLEPTRHQEAST